MPFAIVLCLRESRGRHVNWRGIIPQTMEDIVANIVKECVSLQDECVFLCVCVCACKCI